MGRISTTRNREQAGEVTQLLLLILLLMLVIGVWACLWVPPWPVP